MNNLSQYIIEKLHLNKDINVDMSISFDEWCKYIEKIGGCIIRNTRYFWIIDLKKYENKPVFPKHCDFSIEVPAYKQNYWRAYNIISGKAYSNKDIVIEYNDIKYTIKLEDLDIDSNKRFTFTKNNANQIIKLLNDIDLDN